MTTNKKSPGFNRVRVHNASASLWFFTMLALAIFTLSASASNVVICRTNSLTGKADTNYLTIYAVSQVVNADGSFNTIGLPIRSYPGVDGKSTNYLRQNNYIATNKYFALAFSVPDNTSNQINAIDWQVPGSYNGANYFVIRTVLTNLPNQLTNTQTGVTLSGTFKGVVSDIANNQFFGQVTSTYDAIFNPLTGQPVANFTATATNWNGAFNGSFSGDGSGLTNLNWLSISNNPVLDIRKFGAWVDGQTIYNSSFVTSSLASSKSAGLYAAQGSSTIWCTNWTFTAADIGKQVEVVYGYYQTNATTAKTDITTVRTNVSCVITNVGAGYMMVNTLIPYTNLILNVDYGHDDTPAVQAAMNYGITNLHTFSIYIPNNGYALFLDGPWITNRIVAGSRNTEFYSILTLPVFPDFWNNPVIAFVSDSFPTANAVGGGRILCSRSPDKAVNPDGSGATDYYGRPFNFRTPFTIIGEPYRMAYIGGANNGGFNLIKLVFSHISVETYWKVPYNVINCSFLGSFNGDNFRIGDNMDWGMTAYGYGLDGFTASGTGLILPQNYNNVDVDLDNYYGNGFKYNVIVGECSHLGSIRGYRNIVGLMQLTANHACQIDYTYVYGAIYPYVAATNTIGSGYPWFHCEVNIGTMDIENADWTVFWDPGDIASGKVNNIYWDVNGYSDFWTSPYTKIIGGSRVTFGDAYRGTSDKFLLGKGSTNFTFTVTALGEMKVAGQISTNLPSPITNCLLTLSTNGLSVDSGSIKGNGAGLTNVPALQYGVDYYEWFPNVAINSPGAPGTSLPLLATLTATTYSGIGGIGLPTRMSFSGKTNWILSASFLFTNSETHQFNFLIYTNGFPATGPVASGITSATTYYTSPAGTNPITLYFTNTFAPGSIGTNGVPCTVNYWTIASTNKAACFLIGARIDCRNN